MGGTFAARQAGMMPASAPTTSVDSTVRGGGRVRAASGSGLGLAIAQAVAQAHGGSLRVIDPAALGESGNFTVEVRLPLRAALATLAT